MLIVCCGVFGAFFYMTFLWYSLKSLQIQKIQWDVSTVTASDYTAEVLITEDFFNDWKKREYKPEPNVSIAKAFKTYLKTKIQDLLVIDEKKSRLKEKKDKKKDKGGKKDKKLLKKLKK